MAVNFSGSLEAGCRLPEKYRADEAGQKQPASFLASQKFRLAPQGIGFTL
ncbi:MULTISPECIES: hypothetical protein [Eikenella]|nr:MULTISPECIES: hypothetical protein [Eikenella]